MSLSHIVQCISKSALARSDSEVAELVDWFLNMCPLNIKPDVARDILRNCEFLQCQRDDVIIRQGDLGDSFYIILDGKVSVYINTEAVLDDPDEEGGETADETAVDNSEYAGRPVSVSGAKRKASKGGASAAAAAAAVEKKELDRTKFGNFIVNFGAGKSFGELALINKDCVRNASIIADEATLLIEVNRDLYNRSLRAVQEAELRDRFEFVSRCNVFDSWPPKYRKQAAMSLRKENYAFDAAIVRQGEPLNGLHFIISGQAKIVVNIPMHASQYPQLGLHEFSGTSGSDDLPGVRVSTDCGLEDRAQTAPHRRIQQHQRHNQQQQQQQQRHLELSLVGPGELIGDIEQGMDLPTYAQSVVCTQPSVAFVLDAKNYDRLAQNKRNPGRSQDVLVERAKAKLTSRAGRPLDWRVPLIRCLYEKIVSAQRAEVLHKEMAAAAAAAPNYAVRSASVAHFIPGRGPLIDPYGPGTVFYRNRVKREQRAARAARTKTSATVNQGARQSSKVLSAPAVVARGSSPEPDEADTPPPEGDLVEQSAATQTQPRRKQFEDVDTSSERLSNLESRIDNWLRSVDATKAGAAARPVTMMSRFRNEDEHKIYPGRRVCMRPRRPPITRLTTAFSGLLRASGNIDDHEVDEDEDGPEAEEEAEVFITAQQMEEAGGSFVSIGCDGQRLHNANLNAPNSGLDRRRRPAAADSRSQQFSQPRQSQAGPQQPQQLHPGAVHRAESTSPIARTAAGHPASPKPAGSCVGRRNHQLPAIDVSAASAPPQHHRSSQLSRSAAASAAESTLTPAERRENTAAVLKEILNSQALPDDVKTTLMELQKMSTVLPDLDSRQFGAGRTRAKSVAVGTVGLGGVCYRCRRHHLASTMM